MDSLGEGQPLEYSSSGKEPAKLKFLKVLPDEDFHYLKEK